MKRKDFWNMHKLLNEAAVMELKQVVKGFGGAAHFGEDYTDEGATGTERPIVLVNTKYNGPQDYYINCVGVDGDDHLTIIGEPVEGYEDAGEIPVGDIEFGHISFITDLIPDKEDKGEPSLIKDIVINTIGGEWLSIDTTDNTWEYQRDANDDDTYISGGYETDDERPMTIIDYDGAYDLPRAVKDALRRLGYFLDI